MGFSLLSNLPAIAAQNNNSKGAIPSIVHPALPPANNFAPAVQGKIAPALPAIELSIPEQGKETPEVKPAYPQPETPRHRKMFAPLNNASANQPGYFITWTYLLSLLVYRDTIAI